MIRLYSADHSPYSKQQVWDAIDKYCESPMEKALAKWRALALLNQEYKSLVFRRLMLQFAGRELTDDFRTIVDRMVAVDTVAREMSMELIGREL